jgi:hypothetical protein
MISNISSSNSSARIIELFSQSNGLTVRLGDNDCSELLASLLSEDRRNGSSANHCHGLSGAIRNSGPNSTT